MFFAWTGGFKDYPWFFIRDSLAGVMTFSLSLFLIYEIVKHELNSPFKLSKYLKNYFQKGGFRKFIYLSKLSNMPVAVHWTSNVYYKQSIQSPILAGGTTKRPCSLINHPTICVRVNPCTSLVKIKVAILYLQRASARLEENQSKFRIYTSGTQKRTQDVKSLCCYDYIHKMQN